MTLQSLTLLGLQTLTLLLGIVRSMQGAGLLIFVFNFLSIGKAGLDNSGKRSLNKKRKAAVFLTSLFTELSTFTEMLVSRFARNDPTLLHLFVMDVILKCYRVSRNEKL